MQSVLFYRASIAALSVTVLLQAFFAAFPQFDIAVSRALTSQNGGFFAAQHWLGPRISGLLRTFMEGAALVILALTLVFGIARWRSVTYAPLARCLSYLSANIIIASLLIVNLLFKEHIGRARPIDVTFFGGQKNFTPPWQVSDQCASNCSFTSGEASLAATLAIPLILVLWPHLRHKMFAAVIAGGFVVLVAAMRVVLGRHFLSDVTLSIAVSVLTALALYAAFGISKARRQLALPQGLRLRAKSVEAGRGR